MDKTACCYALTTRKIGLYHKLDAELRSPFSEPEPATEMPDFKNFPDSKVTLLLNTLPPFKICILQFPQIQCTELLTLLGIPSVVSKGEAEALCALLNKEAVSK